MSEDRLRLAEEDAEELGYRAVRYFDLNPRAFNKYRLRHAGQEIYSWANALRNRAQKGDEE